MQKVLFLERHPILIYSLPKGFQDAGYDVKVSPILSKEQLQDTWLEYQPDLIIQLGHSVEHYPDKREWVKELLKKSVIPFVYWDTEGITHADSFLLPFVESMHPDYVFTICPEMLELYKKKGIEADRLDYAYHPEIHYKTEYQERYACQISLAANGYPRVYSQFPEHYRFVSMHTLLIPLLKNNIKVDIWGKHWIEYARDMKKITNCDIPAEWLHGYLYYPDTSKLYSNSDINLGLQNHTIHLSRRIYEILGSEGFLMTSDTPEVRRLFKPGRDLAAASSPEETLEQISYYLKNPQEREKIRINGKKAVSSHTYKHRAEYIVDTLKSKGIIG